MRVAVPSPLVNALRSWAWLALQLVRGTRAVALTATFALLVASPQREARAVEPESNDLPPRLLVLNDGQVVRGRIVERPGAYLVDRPSGQIVIPFQWVKLTAASLEEACQKQRDGFVNPNANDYVALARWCFMNQMPSQAAEQVEAALRLEPHRSDARELLKQIESATSPKPFHAAGDPAPAATTADGFSRFAERTSAGVRLSTHGDFVQRVQPLLMNKCGNAACHGVSSTSAFQLQNVHTGVRHQRSSSDDNMTTVMRFIDATRPRQSPMTRAIWDRDDNNHRGLFAGPRGREQFGILQSWVEQAAADLGPSAGDAPATSSALSSDPFADARPPKGPSTPATPPDRSEPAARPSAPQSAVTSQFLREILAQERPDAFDPDEFNRRVHGTP